MSAGRKRALLNDPSVKDTQNNKTVAIINFWTKKGAIPLLFEFIRLSDRLKNYSSASSVMFLTPPDFWLWSPSFSLYLII